MEVPPNPDTSLELDPIPIDANDLEFLRDLANKHHIQYFNARFAKGRATSFSLLHKISKSSNLGIGKGYSITAFSKGGWGFAVGYEFSKNSITETFEQAADLANWSAQFVKNSYSINETPSLSEKIEFPCKIPLNSIDANEKIQKILDIEDEAYFDDQIVSTSVNYSDSEVEKFIYNNFGRSIRIKENSIFFILQAIAKNQYRQEGFHVSYGGVGGYELLENAEGKGKEAAENALELLSAKAAPSGVHDLIMDPLLTGTFVHEAFGHAAEADGVIADESILADKLYQNVGSELVSIVDDPNFSNGFGFTPFDDEGTAGKQTMIVEKGKLVGYLHNLETASRMDVSPTGNGRAGSFSALPKVRMTNTYMKAGDASLEEMKQEMRNGLLGVGWKYGYTDPIDGTFQFKLAKAYLIENGEKKQVLRDVAISGVTLDVLQRITMLSKEEGYDAGHCGKSGQSMGVGSGGPYTLIRDMVIGGQ